MGRVPAAVVVAATAVAGCGGGQVALRAASVNDAIVPETATSTPTLLPRWPHSRILECPVPSSGGRTVVRLLRLPAAR